MHFGLIKVQVRLLLFWVSCDGTSAACYTNLRTLYVSKLAKCPLICLADLAGDLKIGIGILHLAHAHAACGCGYKSKIKIKIHICICKCKSRQSPHATWDKSPCVMWPVGRLLAFSRALATCRLVRRCVLVLVLVLVHVGVGVGNVDLLLAFRNGNMLTW